LTSFGHGDFNVQKHGKVGKSIDEVVGLREETFGCFDDIINEGCIVSKVVVGNQFTIGLNDNHRSERLQ
jgi:hypothetical protein